MSLINKIKPIQKITAKAPARIDLAGGTLDLWPLYLFFNAPSTINCAIDQFAQVEILQGPQTKVGQASSFCLKSLDRQNEANFESYGTLLETFQGGYQPTAISSSLWLHAKVLRHFFSLWKTPASLEVSTRCDSPAGAGLGGSSTLNVTLCAAFRKLTHANYSDEEMIFLARDLESTVIEGPAGVQDYWPAVFGGVQSILFEPGKIKRKAFYKQKKFIEDHLILIYSGQSRNSGINNWAVYKGFIDHDRNIRSAFDLIVEATAQVEQGLEKLSFEIFAQGIQKEWEARKKLAPTIATEEMLSVMEQAKSMGATAAKVCGAGGGGCFFIVVPADRKARIREQLKAQNQNIIDFSVVEEGCQVAQETMRSD